MKCIKNKTTGEIKRVTDNVAYSLETKGWGYIPKSELKTATRTKTTQEIVEVTEDSTPHKNRKKKKQKIN